MATVEGAEATAAVARGEAGVEAAVGATEPATGEAGSWAEAQQAAVHKEAALLAAAAAGLGASRAAAGVLEVLVGRDGCQKAASVVHRRAVAALVLGLAFLRRRPRVSALRPAAPASPHRP